MSKKALKKARAKKAIKQAKPFVILAVYGKVSVRGVNGTGVNR